MYLHQDLIDSIFLELTDAKIRSITQMQRIQGHYVLGLYNKDTMGTAVYNNNVGLFNKCLKYNVKPDILTMNNTVRNDNDVLFKLCLDQNVVPTKQTINYIIRYNSIKILKIYLKLLLHIDAQVFDSINDVGMFEVCLKYGVVPTHNTMLIATLYNKIKIFKLILQYIKPTQDIMDLAVKLNNRQIIAACLEHQLIINQEVQLHAIAMKYYKDKRIMHNLIYETLENCAYIKK